MQVGFVFFWLLNVNVIAIEYFTKFVKPQNRFYIFHVQLRKSMWHTAVWHYSFPNNNNVSSISMLCTL